MITKTQLYLFSKLPIKIQNKITIVTNGCWLWQGELNRNGYGRCWCSNKRHMTHRLIYTLLKSSIDKGLLLDHTCRIRNCCNPTHTSPVTHQHNTHRGKARLFKKC